MKATADAPAAEGAGTNRARDLDKRQAIIEAARDLFTGRGYETTTMAKVAREAGIAVGTVYLYFKSKHELLFAVKGDWEAEFLQFLARPELQAIPHHLRARPMLEACFDICSRHTDMVQLMGVQAELIGEWTTHDGGPIQGVLKSFFDEGVAAGAFRQIDTKAATVIAYGMVNQALQQCYLVEGGAHEEQYISALVDAMEHWLLAPGLVHIGS